MTNTVYSRKVDELIESINKIAAMAYANIYVDEKAMNIVNINSDHYYYIVTLNINDLINICCEKDVDTFRYKNDHNQIDHNAFLTFEDIFNFLSYIEYELNRSVTQSHDQLDHDYWEFRRLENGIHGNWDEDILNQYTSFIEDHPQFPLD